MHVDNANISAALATSSNLWGWYEDLYREEYLVIGDLQDASPAAAQVQARTCVS